MKFNPFLSYPATNLEFKGKENVRHWFPWTLQGHVLTLARAHRERSAPKWGNATTTSTAGDDGGIDSDGEGGGWKTV